MTTSILFFGRILRAILPAKLLLPFVVSVFLVWVYTGRGQVVTTLNDSGSGSLREALLVANTIGSGTITFVPDLNGTITLQSPLPDIKASINVHGPSASQIAISGNNAYRIFRVSPNATCVLSGMTLRDGYAATDDILNPSTYGGGAIYSEGILEIANCCVTNNRAKQPNTDIYAYGGGIASVGNLTLSNCIVIGNSAWWEGGGIWSEGILNVIDSTISSNSVYELNVGLQGGGISAHGIVNIIRSRITQNAVWEFGGGIVCDGTVSIVSSSISENEAWMAGGLAASGTVFMDSSTISDNSSGHCAGGLENDGLLTMLNCTVSGNYDAGGLLGGGGILNNNTLRITNCTIAFNLEYLSNAGGGVANGGTFYARNTIIASNLTGHGDWPWNPIRPNDVAGALVSGGHNLISIMPSGITGDETGSLYGVDPRLGALRDNGGPTWTHALLPGSPAIDAGTLSGAPLVDQRGIPRPQGRAVDIGAFELQSRARTVARISASKGLLQIAANGLGRDAWIVECSSNLVDWVPLSTNRIRDDGSMLLADPEGTTAPHRFYRLSTPHPQETNLPAPSGVLTPPLIPR